MIPRRTRSRDTSVNGLCGPTPNCNWLVCTTGALADGRLSRDRPPPYRYSDKRLIPCRVCFPSGAVLPLVSRPLYYRAQIGPVTVVTNFSSVCSLMVLLYWRPAGMLRCYDVPRPRSMVAPIGINTT